MLERGYTVATRPGELNIVYIEGADANGKPNADKPDGWNDRRLLIGHGDDGRPEVLLNVAATTEPGLSATRSSGARARGGVARIAMGQFKAWRMGYHKGYLSHPALVQVMPIPVHRDYNRDSKRTGDRVHTGYFGINQHGTRANYRPNAVGMWSEGCLVGRIWAEHLSFIDILRLEPRFVVNPEFIFTTTVVDGDDFGRYRMPAMNVVL